MSWLSDTVHTAKQAALLLNNKSMAPSRKITGILAGLLLIGLSGFAQAKTLSSTEARAAAWQALQAGKPALTLRITKALRAKPTVDFELVFLQALALHDLGHETAATQAGKHAYRLASTDGQRFDAAHLVAKAHFASGAKGRAQFWLRRATQNAPNARAESLTIRDFRFIRQNKPVSSRFFLSIFPSNNINNGSLNDTVMVNGLPFMVPASGLPHSGTGLTAGFETSYSKQVNNHTRLKFGVFGLGTTYRLSAAAKALGSGKTGADFAFATLEARVALIRHPAHKNTLRGPFTLKAAIGHSWYGGNPLSVHFRANGVQEFHLKNGFGTDVGLGFNIQNRLDDPRASSKAVDLDLGISHNLPQGQSLRFGINLHREPSQSNLVNNTAMAANLRYTLPQMAWDIRPTLQLDYKHTDYQHSFIGGAQRKDAKLSAKVSLFFPKVSYYGFAPTLDLGLSRNNSTSSIHTTHDARVSFGFNSTF